MVARVQGSFATRAVPGTRFTDVRAVEVTGSTNADLLAEAADGAPEGIVLVADHQTAGRGRLDRTWSAPPGSALLVSVLLRPTLAPEQAHAVGLAGGIAACDACAELTGVSPGLKWPNDLVAVGDERWRDRKLAGLLTETIVGGGGLRAVVLGMGLNLTWDGAPPPELAAGAVTLEELAGADVDRERMLVVWLRRLDAELELLAGSDGRARLAARARDRSATLGRRVSVERPDGALTGTATDVTASGHLVVAPDDDGPAVAVAVGDVVHLRHRGPAAG